MHPFKVELWGGPLNGAARYYMDWKTATIQAKKYVTTNKKEYGLSSDAYAEVYAWDIKNKKYKLKVSY